MITFDKVIGKIQKKMTGKEIRNFANVYLCTEDAVVYTDGFFILKIFCIVPKELVGKTFYKNGRESSIQLPHYAHLWPTTNGEDYKGDAVALFKLDTKADICVDINGLLGQTGLSLKTLTDAKNMCPKTKLPVSITFYGSDKVVISNNVFTILTCQHIPKDK